MFSSKRVFGGGLKQGEGELELGEMRKMPQMRPKRGEEEETEGRERQENTKEGETG